MLGRGCREETKFLSVGDCHFNHPGGNGWVLGAGISKFSLDRYYMFLVAAKFSDIIYK